MPQQIVIAEQLRKIPLQCLNDERVDELVVAQGVTEIGDVYLAGSKRPAGTVRPSSTSAESEKERLHIHVTDLGPCALRKGAAGSTEFCLKPFRQKVAGSCDERSPPAPKGLASPANLTLPARIPLVLQPHGQGVRFPGGLTAKTNANPAACSSVC